MKGEGGRSFNTHACNGTRADGNTKWRNSRGSFQSDTAPPIRTLNYLPATIPAVIDGRRSVYDVYEENSGPSVDNRQWSRK